MRTCIQSSSGKAFHLFNFVLPLLFPLVQVFKGKRCVRVFLHSSKASLTRFFCLPLAWRSFLYFFCLLCFSRLFLPESFCMCCVSSFQRSMPLLSKRGIYCGEVLRHEARLLSDMVNTYKIVSQQEF